MKRACQIGSLLLVVLAPSVARAAPVPTQDAKTVVKAFFNNLEKGTGDTAALFAAPAKDVITELGAYLSRDSERQQSFAVSLIAVIGRRSSDKEVRALAARTLLAYATADGKHATRPALEGLLHFSKADFPPKADAEIEKLVRANDPHSEAFLLAAIVEVRSVTERLQTLAAKPGAADSAFINPMWSAQLALARLGKEEAVKHCVETIAGEKDLAQRVRHFPELVFIRHEAATKALIRYLMSEELLPSEKVRGPGTKIALYALEVLAQTVEHFPIKSEGGPSYTDAQLAAARKWVKEQKELKFKP